MSEKIVEGISSTNEEIILNDKYSILYKVKNGIVYPWIKHKDEGEFPIVRESAAGLMALKLYMNEFGYN